MVDKYWYSTYGVALRYAEELQVLIRTLLYRVETHGTEWLIAVSSHHNQMRK
jgi:hypothetical protein